MNLFKHIQSRPTTHRPPKVRVGIAAPSVLCVADITSDVSELMLVDLGYVKIESAARPTQSNPYETWWVPVTRYNDIQWLPFPVPMPWKVYVCMLVASCIIPTTPPPPPSPLAGTFSFRRLSFLSEPSSHLPSLPTQHRMLLPAMAPVVTAMMISLTPRRKPMQHSPRPLPRP